MAKMTQVEVHPSAFPERFQEELQACFRQRQVDSKFHYLTYKQSLQWLRLHDAFSPAQLDAACIAIYDDCFREVAREAVSTGPKHVISLGSGGGQKDARLLQLLQGQGGVASYIPCEVSLALALTSKRAAPSDILCRPIIADLTNAEDLAQSFPSDGQRLILCFGLLPNFEPEMLLARLSELTRVGDILMLSANLAPGSDYAAGVRAVLPGYDNTLTREWLGTFLQDLGVEPNDGTIKFSVEDAPNGLKRIVADYKFNHSRELEIYQQTFRFGTGDSIRLFYSYRYTPELLKQNLVKYNLVLRQKWIAPSGEEGVFLCARAGN